MNLGHMSLVHGDTVSTWISSVGRGQASDNHVLSSTAEVPFSSWDGMELINHLLNDPRP